MPESDKLLSISNKSRLENLMGEKADPNNIFLEIHAGAGGTESQDWAEMLIRMYIRWAEKQEAKVMLLQETRGEDQREGPVLRRGVASRGARARRLEDYRQGVDRKHSIKAFCPRKTVSLLQVVQLAFLPETTRARSFGREARSSHTIPYPGFDLPVFP